MCAVSMIMDHYRERWEPRVPQEWYQAWPVVIPPQISQAEVDEFRRLLERAREYDRRMNQPDCEMEDKRAALKRIACAMGININFIDEHPAGAATDGQSR